MHDNNYTYDKSTNSWSHKGYNNNGNRFVSRLGTNTWTIDNFKLTVIFENDSYTELVLEKTDFDYKSSKTMFQVYYDRLFGSDEYRLELIEQTDIHVKFRMHLIGAK